MLASHPCYLDFLMTEEWITAGAHKWRQLEEVCGGPLGQTCGGVGRTLRELHIELSNIKG